MFDLGTYFGTGTLSFSRKKIIRKIDLNRKSEINRVRRQSGRTKCNFVSFDTTRKFRYLRKFCNLLEALPRLRFGYADVFLGDDKWLIERLCIDCDFDIRY